MEVHGRSLDEVSVTLGRILDRPVINKTGITGKFDFHLEYGPDLTTPGWGPPPADPSGPSIRVETRTCQGPRNIYRNRERGAALRKLIGETTFPEKW